MRKGSFKGSRTVGSDKKIEPVSLGKPSNEVMPNFKSRPGIPWRPHEQKEFSSF